MQSVRIKRGLGITALSNGGILAQDGDRRQWVMNGPPWLDKLLHLLSSGCTMDVLKGALASEAAAENIRTTVTDLLSEGILETFEPPERGEEHPAPDDLQTHLSRWGIGPGQVARVSAGCPILVVGTGAMAEELMIALRSAGLTVEHAPAVERSCLTKGGALLIGSWSPSKKEAPVVLNRFALQHNRPWLSVTADAYEGRIGPLFVPGQTACWECYGRRLESNRRFSFRAAIPEDGRDSIRAIRDPAPPPPFIRQIFIGLAVMEVLRFLFGHESSQCLGRVLFVDLMSCRMHSEAVLRLPTCPACGPQNITTGSSRTEQHAASIRRAHGVARAWGDLLVARHAGIVRTVHEVPARWDDPKVFMAGAELGDLEILGAAATPAGAGGVGLTHDDAWCAAVGEAAERYCGSFISPSTPRRKCSWNDIGKAAVDPETLAVYSCEQYARTGFPFRHFDRTTEVTWVAGRRLTTQLQEEAEPYWLPTECIYLNFPLPCTERPIYMPTSTGLAAGASLEDAILAGLCEVIERDAFVVAWRNSLSAPRVDLCSREVTWLRELLEDRLLWPRIEYHIADLTSDVGCPVYAVVSRGPSEDGVISSFGAACHPDAKKAVLKAVLEAAMGRVYIRQLERRHPGKRYRRDFSDVRTFADHAHFYTRHPRHWSTLRRLVSSDQLADLDILQKPVTDAPPRIGRLLGQMESLNLAPCWCDLTTPDVGAAGLRVVRALVPPMQPLHGDHRLPFLGGRRYLHPEEVFGWAGSKRWQSGENPLPHPYP